MVTAGREEDRTMEAIFRIKFLLANYQETKFVKAVIQLLTHIFIKEKAEEALWQGSLTNLSVGHMLKY